MKPLSLSFSMSRRVCLPSNEFVHMSIQVDNITAETTSEEIASLVEGNGEVAYQKLSDALLEKISAEAKL